MSIQLNLEVTEIQLLMTALGEIPLKQSLDVWLKVRGQTEAQLGAQAQAQAQAAAPAPEPAEHMVEPD